METMALRRVFTKGIPRTSGLSQREVSSQLHLGNTWSSPLSLESRSTEAGLGNSSRFPPSSTSQTYFRAQVLFHRNVTGTT